MSKAFITKHLKKIKKICDRCINNLISLYNPQSACVFVSDVPDNEKNVDLIVVAFNDLQLLEYQNKLIKKYLENYNEIICDNSNDKKQSNKIYQFCVQNNISYVKVPHFMFETPSHNHGRALNWIMKNVISKNKRDFVFLDHDMFPFAKIDLRAYFQKNFWGRIRTNGKYWYLTPVICGFNFKNLEKYKTNFLPSHGKNHCFLDTGSGNYFTIYQYLKDSEFFPLDMQFLNIHTREIYDDFDKSLNEYTDKVEIVDHRWLHICGGSLWGGKHNKFELAKDFMLQLQEKGYF